MTRQELESFFEHYGRAITAGDLEATVACFAPPSIIVDDSKTTLMANREQPSRYFDGVDERY